MKDYRRPVDNERLQESELRPVSRPPTYSSGAPVYNPHATWVNCNKSKTWEEGNLLASISGRTNNNRCMHVKQVRSVSLL